MLSKDSNQATKVKLALLAKNHKRKLIIGGVLVLAIALILNIFLAITTPERSVASFCKVAGEEKSVLTGDVSEEKRLATYKRLESVAPNEIHADISTIRKGYEAIVNNPADSMNAGLGMIGAESRRTKFIKANCSDF